MSDDIDATITAVLMRAQQARGFTEYFKVGDLVRFPLGVAWNRERDYRVHAIYNNGFEVESNGHIQSHTDEAAHRLGMTHSPNQVD